MLRFLHNAFMGEKQELYAKINDITTQEFIALISVTAVLIVLGLYPQVLIELVG